jgi:dihydropteroate synthase
MIAPRLQFKTRGQTLELGERPRLMGVVNATPDSFSDAGLNPTLAQRLELARSMVDAGAGIIDIGGESGVTNGPAVSADEEIERVVPLIELVSSELGVPLSVDTYKPEVARAAIAAGASIVNDISGLRDRRLADVCVETGAGLILMHTRAAPKQKLLDPSLDGRVADDVEEFLRQRIALAVERGVEMDQLMLDPGPDFGKTPAQTVEVLRALPRLHELGRPLLLAVSRKDFIGAITDRPPRARLGGTLAAVAHGTAAGVHVLRVHDVREVADFLAVDAALSGASEVNSELRVADAIRWEQDSR